MRKRINVLIVSSFFKIDAKEYNSILPPQTSAKLVSFQISNPIESKNRS
jgi:hypothetical protein